MMTDKNKKRSRAQKGGAASAQSPTRQYPLRAVVGFDELTGQDILECGHMMLVGQDMLSEYHAARRRCRKCYLASQAETAQ